MRLTAYLMRCHGERNWGRWKKYNWYYASRRKIRETNMRRILEEKGIPVYDAVAEAEVPPLPKAEWETRHRDITGPTKPVNPLEDPSHPLWNNKRALMYRDHNVLVQGLDQAKIFTNTVELQDGLPEHVESLIDIVTLPNLDDIVKNTIMSSLVYDGEEVKLPRRRNPARPAVKGKNVYGMSAIRKNYLLSSKLLNLCESLVGPEVSKYRGIFPDAVFGVPLAREGDLLNLQLTADILVTSDMPLTPIVQPEVTIGTSLPDMSPLKYTLSLEPWHYYHTQNVFPVNPDAAYGNIHTAFIYYDSDSVKNLFEEPVEQSQILSRSLMKAFTFAASQAKAFYGEDVGQLPTPITVQCVQTDSQYFHFSVFQLNTLAWPPSDQCVRNVFWQSPILPLYEFCGYFEALPKLTEYNPEIFKRLVAFYINGRKARE